MRPSQPLMMRLRLTTKQVNGGYYKGTRSGSMGFFNKHGEYVIDYRKVRTYAVPENLKDFKLTPFVTKTFSKTPSKYKTPLMTGKDYLEIWKTRNYTEYESMLRSGETAENGSEK
ncbi:50S ribosomal protein YmL27 [Talaromyces proteolyticus]|uniref:50S ribosomal protein YmL27 n=1 Tax=Talaromyces proteolyticus TaxID=1131652 RepID=A0AAD4Q2J7_9EURO|nr:50S ribosomal protein YmL27 [Talaromyces proteolyticus]KAH8700492.1 50S ribosomal protein YmL27 [Talaromyces proteolyticus]